MPLFIKQLRYWLFYIFYPHFHITSLEICKVKKSLKFQIKTSKTSKSNLWNYKIRQNCHLILFNSVKNTYIKQILFNIRKFHSIPKNAVKKQMNLLNLAKLFGKICYIFPWFGFLVVKGYFLSRIKTLGLISLTFIRAKVTKFVPTFIKTFYKIWR